MPAIAILWLAFLFSSFLRANPACFFTQAAKHPELRSNAAFLEEVGARYNQMSQVEFDELVAKHLPRQVERRASTSSAQPYTGVDRRTYQVNFGSGAKTDTKKLLSGRRVVREKYELFVESIQTPGGLKVIKDNPNSWNFEALPQKGANAYTVRLDQGYRILFDLDETTNSIIIREVSRSPGH